MTLTAMLGLLAGTLTTVAFLPQVIRAYRTRSTRDVSLTMMVVLILGICLWLAYGLILNDLPLILANSVTFLLVALIIAAKLRWG